MWKVAANIWNEQSQTADKGWTAYKGWSSSVVVGEGANNSPNKLALLQNRYMCLRPGLALWYDLSSDKGREIWHVEY